MRSTKLDATKRAGVAVMAAALMGVVVVAVAGIGVAACGDSGGTTDSGTRDRATADGRIVDEGGVSDLKLTLYPATLKGYPGGTTLLLAEVVVEPKRATVSLSATAQPSVPLVVLPKDKSTAGVYELEVKPQTDQVGSTITVELTAKAGSLVRKVTTALSVVKWDGGVVDTAKKVRDLFVPWLAKNKPELGITATTTWEEVGTVPEIVVVAHYIYLSPEWEMDLAWHVMIAPYDWADVTLRRRSELKPSFSAHMGSVSGERTVTEQTPPDHVFR